jgi:DNA-binding transcriptional MerR regulator
MPHEIFSIGDLARRSATNVQTIRYYEDQGLMKPPPRSHGGQRRYGKADANRLAFIRHARELGFGLEPVRELLRLVDEKGQSCARVDGVAQSVLDDVEAKIVRLEALRDELRRMIRQCRRGRVDQCRVVEVLADHSHSKCLSSDHGVNELRETPVRKRKQA